MNIHASKPAQHTNTQDRRDTKWCECGNRGETEERQAGRQAGRQAHTMKTTKEERTRQAHRDTYTHTHTIKATNERKERTEVIDAHMPFKAVLGALQARHGHDAGVVHLFMHEFIDWFRRAIDLSSCVH